MPVILPRHDPPFLYLVGLERLDYKHKPTPQDYVKRAEPRRKILKARRNGEPDPCDLMPPPPPLFFTPASRSKEKGLFFIEVGKGDLLAGSQGL